MYVCKWNAQYVHFENQGIYGIIKYCILMVNYFRGIIENVCDRLVTPKGVDL